MNRRSFASRWHLLVDISDIKAAETDLIKLKLQYRRAEGAKRAHREETQGLLSRQTNGPGQTGTLSVKQETTGQHLAAYQQRVEVIEKLLDQLKEGVELLLRLSCDRSVTREQSGSSDGVQDENVVEYLRRVDNRVKELLTLQAFIHFQQNLNPWDIQSPYDCWAAPGKELTSCQSHHCCWDCFTCVGVIVFCAGRDMMLKDQCLSDDPDGVELLLLEEKEPLSRDDLQKRIQRRRKTDRLT
ncbi:hypothetical protein VZT92_026182 [Zoarces viviparus]|uniref:Uncharacterized protein n=1 Tax=Zoarces viviparus TaxID=48416 RepID=A0AAW1E1P4_ZOAVI